ncbi:MAG TPA: diaminopimelate epimerase [Clostridia bacterium]|nr:diaminopimelate epimerase [Clostridia bacterium]
MHFIKGHGLGNDFIIVDGRFNKELDYGYAAKVLCHRQTGVGADGLLVLLPSKTAAFKMRIFNADGSEAEMCGNGIRVFAKYLHEAGLISAKTFEIETLSGNMLPELILDESGRVEAVRVNMGKPNFKCEEIPVKGSPCQNSTLTALGREFCFSSVRVGVPVTAVPVAEPEDFDLRAYGPAIEKHALFPEGTNVSFFKVLDAKNIIMRIWERGAGPTLACGTGASGTAVLCSLNGLCERRVHMHLPLGKLFIEWENDGFVYMSGPAELVFEADFPDEKLKQFKR